MDRATKGAARASRENKPFIYREYTPEQLKEALRKMYLIRQFEERAEESYMCGLIHGTMHLSIGQEAPPSGYACRWHCERCGNQPYVCRVFW